MKKLNDSAGATRRGSFGEKMEAAEGETIMVHFEKLVIPAASLGPLNPMPDIKNVSYIHAGYEMTDKVSEEEKKYIGKGMIPTMLPYRLQDGYDREKKPRAFQAAVVENDHVRVVFLPELGGRLYSIYDKDERKELLYVNPVFQPGNLGLRNAWFSGGVEFNVGIKGHNPLTCSPVFAAVDQTPEGEVLRLYEFERIRGVAYSVSAWVREDSPTLYLRCRIENRTDETKHMYWWSNIAVPETPGTRVIVPAQQSFLSFYNADHYILDKTAIPMADGVDVSYPAHIPSSRDFFYQIPDESPKWIASANEEGYGLLQCSTRRLFGRKMFVWGMGQGGRHWNEWLSEKGSAYIEIQAGLAHTQLEHIPMAGVAGGIHAAEGRPESAARRVWRGCPDGGGLPETAGRRPGRDAFPGGRDRDPHETGLRRLRVGSCGRNAAGRTCQRDTGLPEDKRPGKRGLARFAGKRHVPMPRSAGRTCRLRHGPGMAGKAGGAA